MNKECNILIGSHPSIQRGMFEIHHIEGNFVEGSVVMEDKKNIVFKARGSLGEDFVAAGIVYREIHVGKKVLLLRNPADSFAVIE